MTTMEQEIFEQRLRDALAHLYDQRHLEAHPLAGRLAPSGQPLSGAGLRRALLAAIEQLKPTPQTPRSALAWRQYHHLHLRYSEGLELEEEADELQVSTRQARRDHLEAVRTLAAVLWRTHRTPTEAGRAGAGPWGDAAEAESGGATSPLDADLDRMGSAPFQGPVDVAEVARGARETVAALARAAGVDVVLRFPADTPAVAVNRTVLRQVLVILLTQVVHAFPGRRAQVAADDAGHWVVIELAAERGVAGQPTPRLLAVADRPIVAVRRLVELQGGTIEFATEGDGPIATLRLPRARVSTVLVIEDNPDAVQLFRRYLQHTAFRVVPASTGEQALRLTQTTPPDVITLDVMMPYQDGWEVLRVLKADAATGDVPVIVCSVLDERALALSLGADDFLPKPVTQAGLLAALERWGRTAEARRG